jgi:ribosome biogenesis GTPase
MSKKRKIRVDFQKNTQKQRRRRTDLTREFHHREDADHAGDERVRAKGQLSRKRTIVVDEAEGVAAVAGKRGRVLSVQGLYCFVVDEAGVEHRCYVRRLLKSLESDGRSVAAVGDWVRFREAPGGEGLLLSVEPRGRSLVRRYRGREQTIATNVDQVLIASALASPDPKISLIDRWLVRAESCGLRPVICFNKRDLVDPTPFIPIVGLYARLGYAVVLTSAATGQGLDELRAELAGAETVVLGQSGVGKSSLLNGLDPKYSLAVKEVSESSRKGRHTTTTARLLGLREGGSVIDTPGVRQFELTDVDATEVVGCFPEFRPYLHLCKYAGCTHGEDEVECGVARAVVDRAISASRYDSYLRILEGFDE